jgi:hypothetical protein
VTADPQSREASEGLVEGPDAEACLLRLGNEANGLSEADYARHQVDGVTFGMHEAPGRLNVPRSRDWSDG